MTQDIPKRLIEHNAGKSKFTSGHVPWVLIYQETVLDSKEARAQEKYLKSAAGKKFLETRIGNGSPPD